MTWIVGRAGPFGYAVAISDIRVTLRDGREFDCLQKIYNIGPDIALGFAGSVSIGLEAVHQLSHALRPRSPSRAWDPTQIAREMIPRGTRELFHLAPLTERALGCSLMLLGAHPTRNDGDAPFAKCYVYRFFSPRFDPVLARGDRIVSIGSGGELAQYKRRLARLQTDFQLLNLETVWQGGAGIGLTEAISGLLARHPARGISRHVHVCLVSRGRLQLGRNDRTLQERPEDNFIMPPVAASMDELNRLLGRQLASAVRGARC